MGHQAGYTFKTASGGGSDFRHILGWSLEKYPTTTVEDADDNVDNDDGVS